jgi:hypothetical protein
MNIYASICSSTIEISIMHSFNIIFLIFLQNIGTITIPNVVKVSNASKTHMVRYKVCSLVENKDKIFNPKLDSLHKHAGKGKC